MEDEQSTDVVVQETDLSGINDINFDEDSEEQSETTTDEQSTEKAEETESEEQSNDEETDADDTETTEDAEETQETEEVEQSDEEKRKAFNREQAEKRIQAKQQRELSIKEQQDNYLAEAEDNRDLALRQLQIDAYTNKVDANTNKLSNGYERAIKDFDVLSSDDPAVKARIDRAIDAFQAMHVKLDGYGNPVDVSGDLYQYLQEEAESISSLTGIGARQQVENKGREKSKTMQTPNRSPKQSKDPLMDSLLSD